MRRRPKHRSGRRLLSDNDEKRGRRDGPPRMVSQEDVPSATRNEFPTPRASRRVSAGRSAGSHEHGIGARVSRRAADRLRAGHVWVYASDVESLEAAGEGQQLMRRHCCRWRTAADCCWGRRCTVRRRRSRCGWFRERRSARRSGWSCCWKAASKRDRRVVRDADSKRPSDSAGCASAKRMRLPGLVVDKYGELVILQLLAKGLDSAAVREDCVRRFARRT